jgi:hypothetical protein
MLEMIAVKPEQEALMKLSLAKINELNTLVNMYLPSEPKLFARQAIQNAAQFINTLILNGKLGIPDNAQTMAPQAGGEKLVPNEPGNVQPDNEPANCDAA